MGRTLLPERIDDIVLISRLCKCDLVTQMVTEFPTLQGVMGEAYARLEGLPGDVCAAIREHYLPERAGGDLPTGALGAIVGVADRMDTIVGCFAVGLEPTGSADPFALRRHALSVIRIMEARGWDISLKELIGTALELLREDVQFTEDGLSEKVTEFFRERYRYLMLRSGFEGEVIEAVISVGFDHIPELRVRCEELRRFASESGDFQGLAVTFKRVTNILKNQEQLRDVDPSLFREPCEAALWETYLGLKGEVDQHVQRGEYYAALGLLAGLKAPVDAFFDGVEVLARENRELMHNRVGILRRLSETLNRVADFSKFAL